MTPAMRFRRGRMFAVISSVLFLVAVLADERAVDLVAAETVTQSESVTAARTRLLGEGWDAPDQVRLRWFGVSNFVASFGGHVVLLDGWVIEGATSGYVPITVGDLIAARPEFIYVGHGHFDHMAHVGEIAEATGAKVVTSSENCAIARSDASDPESISCVPVVDRTTGEPFSGGTDVLGPSLGGSTPWGAVGVPAEAPRGLVISVIRNKHSGPRPPDAADPRVPLVPPPNPSVIPKHPPRGQDAAHFSEHAADAPNGTLAFLFTFGDLTLLWHDSALQPGGARSLRDQGRLAVPRRCGRPDRGHWLGEFNQFTNGLKDAGDYIEAATPKVFIPTHHDNFLPPLTTEGRAYFAPLVAELGRIPPSVRPELCFITDPESYSTVFDFTISRWAGGSHGTLSGCVMAG